MIIFLFMFNLWGQEVVVQSSDSTHVSYEKFLLEHPNHVSFVDFFLKRKDKTHMQLYDLLKKAQFEFLNGSIEMAKKYFMQLTEFQHLFDWDSSERKLIHFSFMRYAQLEENKTKRLQILKSSLDFDEDLPIDSNLFPPPLVKEYLSLKDAIRNNVWQLPAQNQEFTQILINGKKHDHNSSFIKSNNQKKRFTFLSNTYQPVHMVMSASEMQGVTLPLDKIASGPCDSPVLNLKNIEIASFLYFEDNCIKMIDSNRRPLDLPIVEQSKVKKRTSYALLKNKWFWIGASALASGLIFSSLNNSKKSKDHQQNDDLTVPVFSNE